METARWFALLPAELFLHTLAFLTVKDLARLLLVNRLWHDFIIDHNSLWTILEDVPAKYLAALLRRSASLPVSLQLDCDAERDYDHTCRVIGEHLDRIWGLHLVINRQGWHSSVADDGLLALLTTCAPILRDLKLDSGCARLLIGGPLFQATAPLLRRVHLDGVELSDVQPAFSSVTHLTGQAKWYDNEDNGQMHVFAHVAAVAVHFPSVRHLHLSDLESIHGVVLESFPRSLDTLRLDYNPDLEYERPAQALGALEHANWERLRHLSISNAPAGLVARIVHHLRDAVSLALDRGADGRHLELRTRSGRTLTFIAPPLYCLDLILDKPRLFMSGLEHVLLGPCAAEDFGTDLSALFAAAPNVRVLTVVLPLRWEIEAAAHVLDCASWICTQLCAPSLEELRVTASPSALGAPSIRPATLSRFVKDVLGRKSVPLLSLWRVDLTSLELPGRWSERREHKIPFAF